MLLKLLQWEATGLGAQNSEVEVRQRVSLAIECPVERLVLALTPMLVSVSVLVRLMIMLFL